MYRNILSLILLLTLFFTACKKPQGFDYREVRNVEIKSLGFDKSSLNMDLVYFNPNGFGVDLRRVDCDIFVDNNYLGKYKLDTILHIARRSEFTLPSKIEVDMKGVFKNLLAVVFNKEIELNVKGTTRVGKAGIFVNVPFNYKGKHSFSMF